MERKSARSCLIVENNVLKSVWVKLVHVSVKSVANVYIFTLVCFVGWSPLKI